MNWANLIATYKKHIFIFVFLSTALVFSFLSKQQAGYTINLQLQVQLKNVSEDNLEQNYTYYALKNAAIISDSIIGLLSSSSIKEQIFQNNAHRGYKKQNFFLIRKESPQIIKIIYQWPYQDEIEMINSSIYEVIKKESSHLLTNKNEGAMFDIFLREDSVWLTNVKLWTKTLLAVPTSFLLSLVIIFVYQRINPSPSA